MDWPQALLLIAISAFVGYITNWVAIKMLFRPKKEWRIGGVRVPFTPGLFPQRRDELALNLGRAVREHLLTDEAVAERLKSPEIRERVNRAISDYGKRWLKRDLPSINNLIPPTFQTDWENTLKKSELFVEAKLNELLSHPEFEKWIQAQIETYLDALAKQPLSDWLTPTLLDRISNTASAYLLQLIREPSFHTRLNRVVEERFEILLKEDPTLSDLLPSELKVTLWAHLEEQLPAWLDQSITLLDDESIKKRIRIEIYETVDQALTKTFRQDSLWDQIKLGFIEGYFMSAEELKERIDKSLDQAAPRLRDWVRQPFIQERARTILRDSIEKLLAQRLSKFNLTPDKLVPLKDRIVDSAIALSHDPGFQKQVHFFIQEQIQQSSTQSLSEIFPTLPDSRAVSEWVASSLLSVLRDKKTIRNLKQWLWHEIEKWLRQPLGKLDRMVSPDLFEKTCLAITDRVLETASATLPQIVQSLDLENLIKKEVDKLSVDEIELLVLRVTGRQLRAITWFGAVLGALIGILQVLLILFL